MNANVKLLLVKVSGDALGNVIIPTANPAFGMIRVTQTRIVINEKTGFAEPQYFSALIPGKIDALKSFGWKKDEEITGKIIVHESLTPFNAKDPVKDFKIAGDTKVVCKVDGKPIYRKTTYTFNELAQDELIAHDNTAEIVAANAELKKANADLGQV